MCLQILNSGLFYTTIWRCNTCICDFMSIWLLILIINGIFHITLLQWDTSDGNEVYACMCNSLTFIFYIRCYLTSLLCARLLTCLPEMTKYRCSIVSTIVKQYIILINTRTLKPCFRKCCLYRGKARYMRIAHAQWHGHKKTVRMWSSSFLVI